MTPALEQNGSHYSASYCSDAHARLGAGSITMLAARASRGETLAAHLQTLLGSVGFSLPCLPAADQADFPACALHMAAVVAEEHEASGTIPLCEQGWLQASPQTAHLSPGCKGH